MNLKNWVAAALLASGAICGSAQANVQTFTSSSDFNAAITGLSTPSAETYSSDTNGQLIGNGATLNGITYSFSGGSITGGIVTNIADSFSGLSLGGLQTGGQQYFFGGDSVTVTFASAVEAIGVFFNVNPDTGTYGLDAAGGSVATDSISFDTDTFVFDGIVSDTPFTSATFFSSDTSDGSFNIPEIITAAAPAAVPEPTSIALFGTMMVGLSVLRCRRKA